jgi:hypothetical protein
MVHARLEAHRLLSGDWGCGFKWYEWAIFWLKVIGVRGAGSWCASEKLELASFFL